MSERLREKNNIKNDSLHPEQDALLKMLTLSDTATDFKIREPSLTTWAETWAWKEQ